MKNATLYGIPQTPDRVMFAWSPGFKWGHLWRNGGWGAVARVARLTCVECEREKILSTSKYLNIWCPIQWIYLNIMLCRYFIRIFELILVQNSLSINTVLKSSPNDFFIQQTHLQKLVLRAQDVDKVLPTSYLLSTYPIRAEQKNKN